MNEIISDTQLLEFVRDYYFCDTLEEAHENLAQIVYDTSEVSEENSYEKCMVDGEYVMPEDMRDFGLILMMECEDDEPEYGE